MLLQFLMRARVLFLETEERKCVVCSEVRVGGARQHMQFWGGDVGIVVECGRCDWSKG